MSEPDWQEPTEQTQAARTESGEQDLDQQREDLAREIRDQLPLEANSVEHCALLAFGHKPCGGPQQYLPYSTQGMTEDEHNELLLKTRRYNSLDRQIKEDRGIVSDCAIVPEPELILQEGQCAVKSERPGFEIY
ncbi:hypothetical protein [Aliidiomarina minuta]|nr:hypothetical protein [Aliidiomarina minuta]